MVEHGINVAQGNWLEHSVAVFGLCLASCIRLEPEWIPREENQMAGYISRIIDHDNWSLDPVMFKVLDDWWGLHTLNSFCHTLQRSVGAL